MSLPDGTLVAFIDTTNNEVVAAFVVSIGGSLNVKVRKGTYRVVAAKKDYLVYDEIVNISEDTSLNIVLSAITAQLSETPQATYYKATTSNQITDTQLSETPQATLS